MVCGIRIRDCVMIIALTSMLCCVVLCCVPVSVACRWCGGTGVARSAVYDMSNEDSPMVIERMRLADETNRLKSPDEDDDVIQYYHASAEAGDVHAQVPFLFVLLPFASPSL